MSQNPVRYILLLCALFFSGCTAVSIKPVDNRTKAQIQRHKNGSLFSLNKIFGKKNTRSPIANNAGGGNKVNSPALNDKGSDHKASSPPFKKNQDSAKILRGFSAYIWKGALDTLSVVPLDTVNIEAGTIKTQWVSVKGNGDSQVCVSAVILWGVADSMALRVDVYKRIKKGGQWVDVAVSQTVANAIKGAILQRARALRIAAP